MEGKWRKVEETRDRERKIFTSDFLFFFFFLCPCLRRRTKWPPLISFRLLSIPIYSFIKAILYVIIIVYLIIYYVGAVYYYDIYCFILFLCIYIIKVRFWRYIYIFSREENWKLDCLKNQKRYRCNAIICPIVRSCLTQCLHSVFRLWRFNPILHIVS